MRRLLYIILPISILLALPLISSARTIPDVGWPAVPAGEVLGTSTQCPNLYRSLSLGSRGQDVVELQNFLIAKGDLAQGYNTGYFGRLTRDAVRAFQCREMSICSGSESTTGWGFVGMRTRARIAEVCRVTTYSQAGYYSQASYYSQGSYQPAGSVSASPPSGAAPLSVTFTASGTLTGRPGEDSTRIEFGDGTSGAMPMECYYGEQGCAPRATHTYTSAGTYKAKVIKYDPRKDCATNMTPDELHPDCASTVVATTVVTVSSGAVGFGARLDVQSGVNGSLVTLAIMPVEVSYCKSDGDNASVDWGDGSAMVNQPGYGIGYLWGISCSQADGIFRLTHDYDPNPNSAMLRKDVTINISLNGYTKSLTLKVGDYDPVN